MIHVNVFFFFFFLNMLLKCYSGTVSAHKLGCGYGLTDSFEIFSILLSLEIHNISLIEITFDLIV